MHTEKEEAKENKIQTIYNEMHIAYTGNMAFYSKTNRLIAFPFVRFMVWVL